MSALSIQVPFPVFQDRDGQPLDNGYVWIGVSNLNPQTNPVVAYFDAALTIVAAQPLRTLNGYISNAGTPAQVYVDAVNFSILVQDSKGSMVYNFSDGTGISPNASGIIYDPAGTGAVATTVQAKLRETVSVKDFGAVGNGVADDTAAFTAALAASYSVTIPAGTYKTTSAITIPSNTSLSGVGKGAVSVTVAADTAAFILSAYSALSGITVAPAGAHTTNLIQVGDSSTNKADRASIYDLIVYGAGAQGIIIVQGNLGSIENVKSYSNTLDGIHFQAVTTDAIGWTLKGFIDLIDNGRDGLHFTGGSSVSDSYASRQHQTIGVTCQQNGRYGVYVGSRSNLISAYCEANTTADVYLDDFAYGNEIKTTEGFVTDASNDPKSNLVYNFNADAAYWRIFQNKTQFSGVAATGWRISNDSQGAGYFDFTKTATRKFSGIAGGSGAVQELIWDNEEPAYELITRFGGRIDPLADNAYSVGESAARWSVIYAATGTINTSDANQKQDISELDTKEKQVAVAIKGLIKKFRFKDAVAQKGDKARIHIGVIAQEVHAAFAAQGLNANEYGLFCLDTLEDGSERLGIRYEELLAFVISTL